MKKILIISVLAITIMMPISGAGSFIISNENATSHIVENELFEDFTHTVFVESASKTTCPYCPAASSQFYSIYNSNYYDFKYVTIVTDKIGELPTLTQPRLYVRLNELGVEYIPDAYFDGGYKHIQGKQQDEQPYRNAIVQSGERDVPDINIDLDVDWIGLGNTIKINVVVTNNDPETFNGKLRVYVTKIESEWTDAQGNNYHYAVLDIPIHNSLAVVHQKSIKSQSAPLGGTYEFTKWWSGDVTKDNCMIFATVFDKDTDYAVQTASAQPASSGSKNHFVLQNFFVKFFDIFPGISNLLKFRL